MLLITIVAFLLILSFLVIIHELGHFIMALWMKIRVEEFGIGYPPRAKVLFHWRNIPFTLNWLPFGGFVKMEGEDGAEEATEKTEKKLRHEKFAEYKPFYERSKRARLTVLFAGVVMNFIFGLLAFTVIYTKVGIPELVTEPRIAEVSENSPAQQAGLQAGDVLTEFWVKEENQNDVYSVTTSQDFIQQVRNFEGETLVVSYLRDGAEQTVEVYVRTPEERQEGQGAVGVAFDSFHYVFYPWWQMPFRGMWVGIQQSIGLSMMIVKAFGDIFVQLFTAGKVPEGVAGPVGIVHQAAKMELFKEGWLVVLNFAAMLSINLAILNVLPIPALDGGRAAFVLLETVIGKQRREKIEQKMNYVGFAVLLGLIGIITLKDIWAVIIDIVS